MTRLRLGLALTLLAPVACAPSAFHRHIDARRWTEAAQAFAADSALLEDERALYRAALLHGTPGTPVYDPARARALLERLLALRPDRGQREAATHLLPMLQELERSALLERRESELQAEIERLQREVERLLAVRDALSERLAVEQEQRMLLRRAVDRLELGLREREEQLRALRTELDRLKAIDLRPPPPGLPLTLRPP